jgi:hypothetical protein
MVHVVEHLPNTHKALVQTPLLPKKKKNETKNLQNSTKAFNTLGYILFTSHYVSRSPQSKRGISKKKKKKPFWFTPYFLKKL